MKKYIMRAPNGEQAEVDSAQVSHYRNLGAAVVGVKDDTMPEPGYAGGSGYRSPGPAPKTEEETRRGIISAQKDIAQLGTGLAANFIPGAGPIPMLARLAAGYVGGAGAEGGVDIAHGQRPDPAAMHRSGLWGLGGQGVGEVVGAGIRGSSQGLMERAVGNQKQLTREAMLAAGANPLYETPEPGIIARQLREEGVSPGKPLGGELNRIFRKVFGMPEGEAGSQTLNKRIAEQRGKKVAALREAGTKGRTYTVQDATGTLAELRAELAKTDLPETEARLLERRVRQFMTEHRQRLPNGQRGKFIRYTPEQFDDLRREWDKIAEDLYVAGKPPVEPTARRRQQFAATMASGARTRMAQDIPGVGDFNAQMRRLYPLRDAALAIEMRPPLNRTNLGIGGGLGLLGGAMPGGPDPATGAAIGLAIGQALSDPAIAGRAALATDNPFVQGAGRFLPHMAVPLLRPSRRDSSR